MKFQHFSWASFTAVALSVAGAPFPLIKDSSSHVEIPQPEGKWLLEASNDALNTSNTSANTIPTKFDPNANLEVQVIVQSPSIAFKKQDVLNAIVGLRNKLRSKHPLSIVPGMQIYSVDSTDEIATYIVPYSFASSHLKYGDAVDIAAALLAYVQRWGLYQLLEFSIYEVNGDMIGIGGIIKFRRPDWDDMKHPIEEPASDTPFSTSFNVTIQNGAANSIYTERLR